MVEHWSPKPVAEVRVLVDPRATKGNPIRIAFCFANEVHEDSKRLTRILEFTNKILTTCIAAESGEIPRGPALRKYPTFAGYFRILLV